MHRSQFSGLKLKIALEGNTLSIDSAVQEVAASPTAKAATLRSQLHDTDHTEPGLNSSYLANGVSATCMSAQVHFKATTAVHSSWGYMPNKLTVLSQQWTQSG